MLYSVTSLVVATMKTQVPWLQGMSVCFTAVLLEPRMVPRVDQLLYETQRLNK